MEQRERSPDHEAEFRRRQAKAKAMAAAKQFEIEEQARSARRDRGGDDGPGGVREPRRPIGPTPHDSGARAVD